MNISTQNADLKKTYIAIITMLLAILCVDMYMVVIKFLGDEYTVIQLAVFRNIAGVIPCLLYTSPSPRDRTRSRMPSSA